MKKTFKLTALALLISSGLFAATPEAPHKMATEKQDKIVFYTLPSQRGIDLRIKKAEPGKTVVTVYDDEGRVLQEDVMDKTDIRRGYNFSQLDEGNYAIVITSKNYVFKRKIHIYQEGPVRSFIVEQV
ncbi:MAG TPA: T9SS type A sorting domain-containing protein [Mucilaginibacter sp.]|jgi:hypothetical protein|nr:T9SS type A sorting domain-containing protein [Mucilaginibacter sp.]